MRRKTEQRVDPCVEEIEDVKQLCDQLIRDMRHAQHVLMDLMLFLDTHPMDNRAREQYMAWRQYYVALQQRYQQTCGPLEWYGPHWWEKAMGYGYDPLDDCFDSYREYGNERD